MITRIGSVRISLANFRERGKESVSGRQRDGRRERIIYREKERENTQRERDTHRNTHRHTLKEEEKEREKEREREREMTHSLDVGFESSGEEECLPVLSNLPNNRPHLWVWAYVCGGVCVCGCVGCVGCVCALIVRIRTILTDQKKELKTFKKYEFFHKNSSEIFARPITWCWKPRSNILSASSMTRYDTRCMLHHFD